MTVEVLQFLDVEPGRAFAYAVQIEELDRFLAGNFLAVAMAPAQAKQVIEECFRKYALIIPICFHADGAVTL